MLHDPHLRKPNGKSRTWRLVGMKYPWGDVIDISKANYSEGSIGGTISVGMYPTNDYGLYDMSRNVLEWCLNANEYYVTSRGKIIPEIEPISGTEITHLIHNFTEVKDFPERAVRDGCWGSSENGIQVGRCHALDPTFAYGELGFRCVKPVNP